MVPKIQFTTAGIAGFIGLVKQHNHHHHHQQQQQLLHLFRSVLGDKIAAGILAQTAGVPSIPWSGDGLTAELTSEGTIPDSTFKMPGLPMGKPKPPFKKGTIGVASCCFKKKQSKLLRNIVVIIYIYILELSTWGFDFLKF